ncbi:MAG: ABC transporter permease [Chloroflexota bacterium]|nr:ABC transporter permease [Chloroflexota bacterium]
MNPGIIRALAAKDIALFFRNRFFALITILGIVLYIVIYFVMPSAVDESLEIGLHAPVLPPVFEQLSGEGLVFEQIESVEALADAVADGDYAAGVALPDDIMEKFEAGQKPLVTLYFRGDVAEEVQDAVEVLIRELSYLQTGQSLAVETTTEVLGTDMLGEQIPLRDRMRPLFAVFIVLFEMMGLASLITEEVEHGTIRALLLTPTTVQDLFAAKGLVGVSMAFGQALLVVAIVGGLETQPLIVVTTLLLGAVFVTGLAFLIASLARDMMSAMGWGTVTMIILVVPAFSVMFPGATSTWAKFIPSYYMVETVYQASCFGVGWADLWQNLAILLGLGFAAMCAGIIVLRRKFQ